MSEASELHELLNLREAEIRAYRELVEAMRTRIADAAAEHEKSEAWTRAFEELAELFYAHGFSANGRQWTGL